VVRFDGVVVVVGDADVVVAGGADVVPTTSICSCIVLSITENGYGKMMKKKYERKMNLIDLNVTVYKYIYLENVN
jgi:hypothetical protein